MSINVCVCNMHLKSQPTSLNSLFLSMIYLFISVLLYFDILLMVYMTLCTYDVILWNKNSYETGYSKSHKHQTRRNCIKILIKCLIFPNLYSATTLIACKVDHGVPKHLQHDDKIPHPSLQKCSCLLYTSDAADE